MRISIYKPQAIYELGKRDNQEDAIFPKIGEATDRDRLFILCDGMGGHQKGEVASNTVSKSMAEYLDNNASAEAVVSDDVLLTALEYAYKQLDAIDDGAIRKMGTTLCLLLVHRGGITAMHIGDSRIYHIRPSEHRIIYQSRDHSLVYDLYQSGEITYDEMRTSPQKNIITRAIQPGEGNRVRPAIVHITNIKPGDYFYICSDGMLEQMENDDLCNLLSSEDSDGEKHKRLINATINNKDNHSAYFIHINKVEIEAGDENLPNDEQTTTDNAINIRLRLTETSSEDVDVVETTKSDEITANDDRPFGKKKKKTILGIICITIVAVIVIASSIIILFYSKQKLETKGTITVIDSQRNTSSNVIKPIKRTSQSKEVQTKTSKYRYKENNKTKENPASNSQSKSQFKVDSAKAQTNIKEMKEMKKLKDINHFFSPLEDNDNNNKKEHKI